MKLERRRLVVGSNWPVAEGEKSHFKCVPVWVVSARGDGRRDPVKGKSGDEKWGML